MAYNFHIIGAGSLGSGLAIELARKADALTMPLELHIYDDDNVEKRNIWSQDFFPQDIDKAKSDVIAEKCSQYENIKASSYNLRVLADNINEVMKLDAQSVIIDCVDNIEARHLLWLHGQVTQTPVMHVGMTETGAGQISWNYDGFDTFPLSPIFMSQENIEAIKNAHEEKKPPCVLNGFRSLITNTYLAAVEAAFIFLGRDNNKYIVIDTEEGPEHVETVGLVTNWQTTSDSRKVVISQSKAFEWPIQEDPAEQFVRELLAQNNG